MSSGLIRKVGPWGGTVKDMDVTGITRISKICIRHRDVIETFMVYFDRNGLEDKTEAWGAEKREQDISWAATSVSRNLRSTNVYKVGPCGSSAGDEMDMNLLGVTRILKIDVCHDKNVIHAFTVYFERFSCEESTNTWGEEGGEPEEITLDSNEHITSISGHLGEVSNIYAVRSLKLKTSHHIHGPYGKEEGIPFEIPAHGGQIIGFHARSSASLLLAIGAYIKVGEAKPSWRNEGDNRFWGRPVEYVGSEGCKYIG